MSRLITEAYMYAFENILLSLEKIMILYLIYHSVFQSDLIWETQTYQVLFFQKGQFVYNLCIFVNNITLRQLFSQVARRTLFISTSIANKLFYKPSWPLHECSESVVFAVANKI